jgi:hypothetical protein
MPLKAPNDLVSAVGLKWTNMKSRNASTRGKVCGCVSEYCPAQLFLYILMEGMICDTALISMSDCQVQNTSQLAITHQLWMCVCVCVFGRDVSDMHDSVSESVACMFQCVHVFLWFSVCVCVFQSICSVCVCIHLYVCVSMATSPISACLSQCGTQRMAHPPEG